MGLPDVRYDDGTEISPQIDLRKALTLFAGVPTMYFALLHHQGDRAFETSSLEICLTGGAPMYRIVPPKGTAETIAGMGGCRTQGYCRLQVKTGGDRAETGKLYAPDAPGLGAAPDFECPGTPAAAFGTAK